MQPHKHITLALALCIGLSTISLSAATPTTPSSFWASFWRPSTTRILWVVAMGLVGVVAYYLGTRKACSYIKPSDDLAVEEWKEEDHQRFVGHWDEDLQRGIQYAISKNGEKLEFVGFKYLTPIRPGDIRGIFTDGVGGICYSYDYDKNTAHFHCLCMHACIVNPLLYGKADPINYLLGQAVECIKAKHFNLKKIDIIANKWFFVGTGAVRTLSEVLQSKGLQ